MSSTRRVEPGARRRACGWASAPEYDCLRGLNGTAVALKAALQPRPEQRELLFFLQALSWREGGVSGIARELMARFPERIGSPTLRQLGGPPDRRLTPAQSRQIRDELASEAEQADLALQAAMEADLEIPGRLRNSACPETADPFWDQCHRACDEALAPFIEALCCDPRLALSPPPQVPYFHDVLGALFALQRCHQERARADYVETSIGRVVFEALDCVLETGHSALIEGPSGFGKTTALKAWCAQHLGRARYVQLSGIMSRSIFFQKVAAACGVAKGGGLSPVKIQARVEQFLRRTQLALVIDEAHYLWPQNRRVETHPELINWLNTACYNEGVPFALSATKEFSLRRQAVERQTDWSSEQLRRRIRRFFPLPEVPTEDDLRAVARPLLRSLGQRRQRAEDYVVGYALTTKGYFQTVTNAVDEAERLARRAGREQFTFEDLETAIRDRLAPSDTALQRIFDSAPAPRRRQSPRALPAPAEAPDETPLSGWINGPLNHRSRGGEGAADRPRTGGRSPGAGREVQPVG